MTQDERIEVVRLIREVLDEDQDGYRIRPDLEKDLRGILTALDAYDRERGEGFGRVSFEQHAAVIEALADANEKLRAAPEQFREEWRACGRDGLLGTSHGHPHADRAAAEKECNSLLDSGEDEVWIEHRHVTEWERVES